MLGIPDASIWLAYVLAIGSAVLCIAYGIVNWNKDNGGDKKEGDGTTIEYESGGGVEPMDDPTPF